MTRSDRKRRWLSRLVLIEIIVCYMAILTAVSYLRGPVRHQIIRETPLLSITDFTSFTGESAKEEEGLFFQNGNEEGGVGYNAHLKLSGLAGVYVAFSVDCPEEYAGNILHIDLQESSVGYDNDDQEFFLDLKRGVNQVEFTLNPGDSPPENVLLRFFTLEPANYTVQNLQVYPETNLPKITGGMLLAIGVCFILLLVTGLYSKQETIKEPACVGIDTMRQKYAKEDGPVLSSKQEYMERERITLKKEVIVRETSSQLSIPDWRVRGVKGWIINPLLQRVVCLLAQVLEQQSEKNRYYLVQFEQLFKEKRELEQKLDRAQQRLDAQQALLEQLKETLNNICNQNQYFSKTLADQSFHLVQAAEKLTTLQNQNNYCAEMLSSHSFRLKQVEEKLVTVLNQAIYNSETLGNHSFRLTQAEEKLDGLQNQGKYNADALVSSSYRLDQAEQKLDTVQNQSQFNSEVLADHNFRLDTVERRSEKLQYQIFSKPNAASGAGYFSQSGEDMIIEYILERLRIDPSKITYLDLGANHAVYLSNTNYFYQRGARGVLVEANPNLIPELELQRQRDTILHRCISESSGNVEIFYILNKDGLSSPDLQSVEDSMRRDPGIKIEKVVDVETISINDILDQYFDKEPTVVNLDIEGKELEILNGLDFKTHRPLIFIIETIPYRTKLQTGEKQTAILDFMKTVGYVEYAFTGINSIFVDAMAFQTE